MARKSNNVADTLTVDDAEQSVRAPRVGERVLYVLEGGENAGQLRPADVVSVQGPSAACLMVAITPGDFAWTADKTHKYLDGRKSMNERVAPGVGYDASGAPGTWHRSEE